MIVCLTEHLPYDFAVFTSDKATSAVCFLVINQIEKLPELAINSVLNRSDQNIVIGYISERDIANLPRDKRISYLNLLEASSDLGIDAGNQKYQTFDQDAFFSLVRLKWKMLELLMLRNQYDYLIYNDVDVYWIQNPSKILEDSFREMPHVEVLIQNFTINPSSPNLCMGFVAFRNSKSALELVKRCAQIHNEMLVDNPRTGDDDVISKFYLDSSFPQSILQLPQGLFPVGNFANLFSRKNIYPGLTPYKPYIFHANFVVGVKKKIQLSHLVLSNLCVDRTISRLQMLNLRTELHSRRIYLSIRSRARSILAK